MGLNIKCFNLYTDFLVLNTNTFARVICFLRLLAPKKF